jgi:hypothetical protein
MSNQPRRTFKSVQDWHNFIDELKQRVAAGEIVNVNPAAFRLGCYKDIESIRNRPLIVYAAKFISSILPNTPNNIDLGDVDGFTDLINSIPCEHKTVDVIIHSPGGQPDATERIVYLLRNRFQEVHFLIPHSAYSAATMLALSGDSITLHTSATLGPIDPQINGIPARSIKKGFAKFRDSVKPDTLPAYLPLIEKYSLELLEICEDSEKLSQEMVSQWLKSYMLKEEQFDGQIKKAVDYFADYDSHLIHSRPLILEKLRELNLNVEYADPALNELLWEAYILIENFFQMTAFVKLFENCYNISWGRQFGNMHSPSAVGITPVQNN